MKSIELIRVEDNFFNFKSLSLEQQEIIKMVFLLAQFVQKVCLDDNLSKYIALEFKNIISSIGPGNYELDSYFNWNKKSHNVLFV